MKLEYRLVYQGQTEGAAEKDKASVVELLRDQYGLGRVLEIEELVDNPPFTIKRSASKSELELDSTKFRGAGATTMIVRTAESPTTLAGHIQQEIHPTSSRPTPASAPFASFFSKYSDKIHEILQAMDVQAVETFARELVMARERNSQIFIFGNGGSAAAASHFANDLAKQRFEDERSLFRVMSLTDNVPWMTATANDIGYEKVFLSQLKNLLQPDDLVIAISSSGNSESVTRAVEYANEKGALTYGIVGFGGGRLKDTAQRNLYIPTKKGQYGYMEDVTVILSHMVSIYIYEQDAKIWGNNQ